jgi:hypothetical protein
MLDIHGLFNFKVKQLTEFDGQETESGIDPIACAQDIDSLAFLTERQSAYKIRLSKETTI